MVSLRQFEYFVTIVDEGSFTRAAEKLHVSQPGLSHQLRSLETELGGPLFERLPKKVRLTPAGRAALPHARASIAHADRVAQSARRSSGAISGELHVGTLYSLSVGLLPGPLAELRREYPGFQAHLVEFQHTNELVAAMEAGNADVAVGPVPKDWQGPVTGIGSEEFVLIGAKSSALAGLGDHVPISALKDETWVHFTRASGLSEILDRALQEAGVEPVIAVRTEQAPSALRLAQAGLGITLVPRNVVPDGFDGVVASVLPPITRDLAVYTRVKPDPITKAFVSAFAGGPMVLPDP
jgi:DNA-binding transcriptional LysR family regulator